MPEQKGVFSRTWVRLAVAAACLLALLALAARVARIETDFSAFLPPSATPEQRLLISQLRDGLVSRLMLVALDGADETVLAAASRRLAEKLTGDAVFDYAANGSLNQFMAQGEILMKHRYALSPATDPARFSVAGLRASLEDQLAELASPFGVVTRTTLARDPTGEFLATLKRFDLGAQPAQRQGVWFSADGRRAFLVLQTKAPGFDSIAQATAIAHVRETMRSIAPGVNVTLTGPGVFAAESHRRIEGDAWKLSMCSAIAILFMLVFVYRSPLPILLVLTPVAFGLTVGVLVVQALFGSVHGITLGFAATLIGEAVDYPNLLLLNTAPGEPARGAARRIGRTLALAVLTTVASAMALTFSSFKGLAQLGVLTMIGVMVAGLCTHRLIPWLLGDRPLTFRRLRIPGPGRLPRAHWASVAMVLMTLGAVAWLAWQHPAWWERELSAISPVPPSMRALDADLRREMGAPEVSSFIASEGATEAQALSAAEAALPALERWKREKIIRGYDSPTLYLPAPATQAARRDALPDTEVLRANLRDALKGLPFRADAFDAFLREAAAARLAPGLTRADYAGTPLGSKLNAQVIELDGKWLVLTPLSGVADAARLARETLPPASRLVDLREVSARMLENYRHEALHQSAWGALLILVLLLAGLRSPRRVLAVMAPAAAALALTLTALVAAGERIGVFHLVALLLVLGIGLNYALFFERPPADANERDRTWLSLMVCSISTIATFGFLALSSTPVLHAIGGTTALGALLALLLSALWANPTTSDNAHSTS